MNFSLHASNSDMASPPLRDSERRPTWFALRSDHAWRAPRIGTNHPIDGTSIPLPSGSDQGLVDGAKEIVEILRRPGRDEGVAVGAVTHDRFVNPLLGTCVARVGTH